MERECGLDYQPAIKLHLLFCYISNAIAITTVVTRKIVQQFFTLKNGI